MGDRHRLRRPVAEWPRQEAFPVVASDAGLIGIVLASQLARIPPADRDRLRLDQVALRVPPAYRTAPDDPAGPLLSRSPLGGEVAAVVIADGLAVGLVTAKDLQRALRWRADARATHRGSTLRVNGGHAERFSIRRCDGP